jgi:hypothetical protein
MSKRKSVNSINHGVGTDTRPPTLADKLVQVSKLSIRPSIAEDLIELLDKVVQEAEFMAKPVPTLESVYAAFETLNVAFARLPLVDVNSVVDHLNKKGIYKILEDNGFAYKMQCSFENRANKLESEQESAPRVGTAGKGKSNSRSRPTVIDDDREDEDEEEE